MSSKLIFRACQFLLGTTVLFLSADIQAGEWGLGVVAEGHQAPQKGVDAIETGVLPFLYYRGDRLSVDFQEASYKLFNGNNFEASVLGRLRFQGYDPGNSVELEGMEERDPAFDAGVRLGYGGRWGTVSLSAVTDIIGKHNGREISAAYSFSYQNRRWTLEPSTGLTWQSEDLVNYYYGVRPSEARPDRPAYSGRSAVNITAGLTVSFKITRHVFAFTRAEYRYLGDNIRKSPIIEKDYEAGGFAGLLYRF